MEITNVESVALPSDLQRKIDAARNNLTLMEQECNRLNELKQEQENQIKETLKTIASLTVQLDEIQKKHQEVSAEAHGKLDKLNKFLNEF